MRPLPRYAIGIMVPVTLALSACGATSEPAASPGTGDTLASPSSSPSTSPSTLPDAGDPLPTTTAARSTTTVAAPATTEPTESTMPAAPTTPPSGSPAEIATADLAARLGVDVDQIEVVSIEEVTWPDGSLGCPEPDRMYTQALVNGSRILLRAAGIVHEYHSGRGDTPFFCPPARVQAPTGARNPDA